MHSVRLDDLRRFTVARSLFPATTLAGALDRMGFVQADPIRAPARAQDLILRHRVADYRAGDLDRSYETLDVSEDTFINYGYVTTAVQSLMHPRTGAGAKWGGAKWSPARSRRARLLLEFVRARGEAHPREINERFAHGAVTNYWGGNSNATTHLLDTMHYRGMVRIARREAGIRIYAAHEHPPSNLSPEERLDALIDVAIRLYAPLPAPSLTSLVRRLRLAAPQWRGELTKALARAKARLAHARMDGVDWYWPADEYPAACADPEPVRLLAPFDPVVWDRARFELLWGWAYRFEAYTPVAKRVRGYYALPLLWRDEVIGWTNAAVTGGELNFDFGYAKKEPRTRMFRRELATELERMRGFLGLSPL
ncbi:MAG TPA: crosslink repair DNA glycosylase YcaQ family protein [Bryobacteraceae bacterium]|nr:crosslink repair DNA glycosylase YcaQ family protein [Bryobacteraceae bacterium]